MLIVDMLNVVVPSVVMLNVVGPCKVLHCGGLLSIRLDCKCLLAVNTLILALTWAQCYNSFYVCNLRLFAISQSVCHQQACLAKSNFCYLGQEPTQAESLSCARPLGQAHGLTWNIRLFCNNLRIFEISQCLPWQVFPVQSHVCGLGQEPTQEQGT